MLTFFVIPIFRYSINKLDEEDVFSITLTLNLCIDEACEDISIFKDLKVPIPGCNTDFTSLVLPGDGSIEGFVQYLGGEVGDAAVTVVLERLGLSVWRFPLVDIIACQLYATLSYFV